MSMSQPKSARSQVEVVSDRFPERVSVIRRLFLREDGFRNICEDYALAVESLARFQRLPDAEYRTEIPEYKKVIRELEFEIITYLKNERQQDGDGQ
jgi:hypothetical protein